MPASDPRRYISKTHEEQLMAIVRKLEEIQLERDAPHKEINATFTIVFGNDGGKYLQIDTYGSKESQYEGKKSQSIRFAPEAISQLKEILSKFQ